MDEAYRLGSVATAREGSKRTGRGWVRSLLAPAAVLVCAAAALIALSSCRDEEQGAADRPADIVFENGAVYTVDPAQEWARAVAVKDKRIVYVGDDAGIEAFKGPKTRVVDLAGRMLMPGFIEGHTHALFGAVATRGVDLQYNTREDTLAALRRYATTPDRGLIDGLVRGFGWRYSAFPDSGPTKADLDTIWPDVPVLLIAVDGHSAWVNSKALQIAEINATNAVVVEGFSYFYQTCKTCEPTGYVVEAPAIALLTSKVAPYTRQFLLESLEAWVPKAASAGITGVFDAGIAVTSTDEGYAIYSDLERRGKLPFRIVGSLYYNDSAIDPFPEFEQLQGKYQSELIRFTTLKVTMDGVDANGSAAMLQPYDDRPSSGETLFTAQQTRSHPQGGREGYRRARARDRRPRRATDARCARGGHCRQSGARSAAHDRSQPAHRSGRLAAFRRARRHRPVLGPMALQGRRVLERRHNGALGRGAR